MELKINPVKAFNVSPQLLVLKNKFAENISKKLDQKIGIEILDNLDDKMIEDIAQVEKEGFYPKPPYSYDYFIMLTKMKDFRTVIVKNFSGDVIGFALGYHEPYFNQSNTYFIDVVAFKDGYRRQGIGTALFHFMEPLIREMGYKKITFFPFSRDVDGMDLRKYYQEVLGYTYLDDKTFGSRMEKDISLFSHP